MNHQEGYFKNKQGQSIFHQQWLPDNKPNAMLLICHGLNEHSGRYHHLAKFFTEKGYGVFGFDQIGHGKSDGTRSFVKDFPTFTDPILVSLDKIKEINPDVPIFLLGHSLGGLICISFLIDYQEIIQGAVISGLKGAWNTTVSSLPPGMQQSVGKVGEAFQRAYHVTQLEYHCPSLQQ